MPLRGRRREAQDLRDSVPPRGGSHAEGARDPRRLPLRRGGALGDVGPATSFVEEAVAAVRHKQVGPELIEPSSGLPPVGSTRRWRRCSASGRSGIVLRASSSTTACSGCAARPRAWSRTCSAITSPSAWRTSTRGPALPAASFEGEGDPEKKPVKIIGRVFIEVFEEEAKGKVQAPCWLVQGRLPPRRDREPVSFKGPSAVIEEPSTTWAGLLRAWMALGLLASRCAELFKDEVCAAAAPAMGMPHEVASTGTFLPRAGLAVRCLGEVTTSYASLRCAPRTPSSTRRSGARRRVRAWIREKTELRGAADRAHVGVMGDERVTYEEVIALRAVESTDGMIRRLGAPALRRLGPHQHPHHQRGARRQPRVLRRVVEALPASHRVGE